MFDICIIGGGVIGCAIARELSKYELDICLLEKNNDVATGSTKANSGIVHGGYAEKHGTMKAKFSRKGNKMYKQLDEELHFGFEQTGSYVIGFDDNAAKKIQEIYENGIKNGVSDLKIVDGEFIRKKERNLNKEITVALYCKSAGITSPYELTIALMENAMNNGAKLQLNAEVTGIKKHNNHFEIAINEKNHLQSNLLINAAGLYADDIAKMAGIDEFTITPRRGQYLLFDKDQGYLANSVIFQTPTEVSKGILVAKTFHGNLLIGPDAESVPGKERLDTTSENIAKIISAAKKSVPDFDLRKVITSFSGNRAASNTDDFIIEESKKVSGFINVAGIESPGLTAAPAIAEYLAELVAATGINMIKKENFTPHRKSYKTIAHMEEKQLNKLISEESAYGRVVCRCETISEGEIREALNRPVPICTLDAIKRRTRAGMGRCQGGFCTPKVMEIMCDELNIQVENITKKGSGSQLVIGRTKKALEEE